MKYCVCVATTSIFGAALLLGIGAPEAASALTPVGGSIHYSTTKSIAVGAAPSAIAIDESLGEAVVTNSGSDTISIIDLATSAVVGSPIAVGSHPDAVTIDGKTHLAYVANYDADSVSVIDVAHRAKVGSDLAVGSHPEAVAVDDHSLYVANFGGSVSVIDTATGLRRVPDIVTGSTPSSVAIDPSLGLVFVGLYSANQIVSISTTTDALVGAAITAQGGPSDLLFEESTGSIFVSNFSTQSISVLDPATRSFPSARTTIGLSPRGMAFDSADATVFVASDNTKLVSVVSNSLSEPMDVGHTTVDLAWDDTRKSLLAVSSDDNSVIVVTRTVSPTFTQETPSSGTVGVAYDFQVRATGFPQPTYSLGSNDVPSWLTFDAISGTLSGTPDAAGVVTVTVTASNGTAPDAVATYSIRISDASTGQPTSPSTASPGAQTGSRPPAKGQESTVASSGQKATLASTGHDSSVAEEGAVAAVVALSGGLTMALLRRPHRRSPRLHRKR